LTFEQKEERHPWRKHQQKAKASPISDPPLFGRSTLINVAFTSTPDNHKTIWFIWQAPAEAVFGIVSSVGTKAQRTMITAEACK